MEFKDEEAKENRLWGNIREFTLSERIIKKINKRNVKNVADIGCGDGFLLYSLSKKRKDIQELYGIDYSNTRLDRIRRINKRIIPVKADVTSLPFEKDSFDVVICSEVLEHIKEYEKAMKELIKIAKNQLILTVPNDQKLMKILCPHCKKHHYVAGHINRFNPIKLKKALLSSAGDKTIKITFEKFHTIYTYNTLTKKIPAFIRIILDKFFTSLESIIPFMKPNYLMAIITIKRKDKKENE